MAKQRNQYFDFLRGIAIVMVVGIHTFYIPEYSSFPILYVIGRELLNFAVPLFLVISGIYTMRSYRRDGNYLRYLKRQIPKVYIPTIIWSLPSYALALYSGKDIIVSTWNLFCCGFSIFYFIALIIQMYCLLPVYQLTIDKYGGVIISGVITAISVLIHTYLLPSNLPLVVSVGPCIYWLIFFAIGVYYSDKPSDYSLLLPVFLIIIGCISQIFEYKMLVEMGRGGIGIKLTSWIYSTGVVLLLISDKVKKGYKENIITGIIRTLGVNSFGIYLVHILVLIPINKLSSNYWIENWILAIICSMALITISKRIFPTLSIKYLGFTQ